MMITFLMIFGLCHLSVVSLHRIQRPPINAPRNFVNVPSTNINYYLYEIMGCYAALGYPCMMNPPFIEGRVTCLAKKQVCDGEVHCPYGDDEDDSCGTRPFPCNSEQVRCNDGQCAYVCNGLRECADGSDEDRCDQDFPCKGVNQVLCSDGKCADVCDGIQECKYGEDELPCLPNCGDKEMVCPENGKCAKYCDGIPECEGKTDELFCPGLPCDLVSLRDCFEVGNCLFRGFDLGECKQKALVFARVSTYLLPCVEVCGSRQELVECICEQASDPRFQLQHTFTDCRSEVLTMLGDCRFAV